MALLQPNGEPMPNWSQLYTDPTSARAALTQLEQEIARRPEGEASNFEAQRNALSWYITAIENPSYYSVNPDGTVQSIGEAPAPTYPGTTVSDQGGSTQDTTQTGSGTSGTTGTTTTPTTEEAAPAGGSTFTMPNWADLYKDPASARAALSQIEAEIARRPGGAPNFEAQRAALSQYITALENPNYWTINPDGTTTAKTPPPDGTTPPPDGGGGTTPPTTPPAITDENRRKFYESIALGQEFGDSLIGKLGFEGEFLPRIDAGPSQTYVDDLGRLRTYASNAGNLDPLEDEALGYARNALAGLSSAENAALRSAAVKDVDRQYGAARDQIMRYQGGLIPQGQRTAQLAQLGAARGSSQRELARDLLIENIAEKGRAREAFSNLASTTATNRNNRQLASNQAVLGGQQFSDTLQQTGDQFNAMQKGSELSTRASTYLGGIGTATGMLGGYAAEDFQKKALDDALAAKDREIEETRKLAMETLASQERILKELGRQMN